MLTGNVRPYVLADRLDCLAIFDSNTPAFFDESERPFFDDFLERHALQWQYQVIERHGHIVACGGYAIRDDHETAELCWGMVANKLHGSGLGQQLTSARLQAAACVPGVVRVRLDTSQHTQGFYARFGFQVERIVPNGYGLGLDRLEMVLPAVKVMADE